MGKTEFIITVVVFNFFFILFIGAIVIYIRQYQIKKKEYQAILHHQKIEHQKELLTNQIEIQQETMQHIGREIHDNIGQKLTLASLYTQQLAYENKAPQINDRIENIGQIINESLLELRQLSKSLTDNTIETNLLFDLLQMECDKINSLKKCALTFTSNAKNIRLTYQEKSVLYRITQEFLQNSIKHSKCDRIDLILDHESDTLELRLRDNGNGFDTTKTNRYGIGLINMKKRAEIIGGKFSFESNSNGTSLTIQIPSS